MNEDELSNKQLFGKVSLGLDVQAFLQSPVGRYLIGKAENERAAALERLATVNPDDTKDVRRAQNKVAVIDLIQSWLAEAITEAGVAENDLQQREGND